MIELTNNDLADFYKAKTGKSARFLPMHTVVDWAVKQPEITVNAEDTLCLIQDSAEWLRAR